MHLKKTEIGSLFTLRRRRAIRIFIGRIQSTLSCKAQNPLLEPNLEYYFIELCGDFIWQVISVQLSIFKVCVVGHFQ